jgi:hypothetical protein
MDVTSKVLFGLDADGFRRGIQQVDAKLKQTSKLMGNLGQLIGASFAVSQIQAFTSEAIQLGSQMETVGKGFERFGDASTLAELRKSTRGLVTDLDLMKAAVSAGNFGIPIEKLGGLLEFAKRRAQETGQEVDYLVNSIITGIGRKSPLILDNLGISTTRLKEKFHGAAIEAQGIADVAAAVGDIASEELGKMGKAVDTAADKMVRLGTSWQNFKASFGQAVAPAASAVLQFATDQLTQMQIRFQLLKREFTSAKPSDKIRSQPSAGGGAPPAVTESVRSLESLREKLKELEAQYASTEIGTAAFTRLRKAIEDANYELGRATGEIWNGAKQTIIELDAKGIQPLTHSLASQNRVLKSNVIPVYDEWAKMIKGAKTQLGLLEQQLRSATAFGAMFGTALTGAFDPAARNFGNLSAQTLSSMKERLAEFNAELENTQIGSARFVELTKNIENLELAITAAMVSGTSFFDEIGEALKNFVQQMIVALATTTALAVLFSAMTGTPLGVSFKGISKATGLGGFFGEDGMFNMNARVSGSDLLLGTQRSGNNFSRSGG